MTISQVAADLTVHFTFVLVKFFGFFFWTCKIFMNFFFWTCKIFVNFLVFGLVKFDEKKNSLRLAAACHGITARRVCVPWRAVADRVRWAPWLTAYVRWVR